MGLVRAMGFGLLPDSGMLGVSLNQKQLRIHSGRSVAQNEPVLKALKELTGKDFGFDKAAWTAHFPDGERKLPNPRRRSKPRPADDANERQAHLPKAGS